MADFDPEQREREEQEAFEIRKALITMRLADDSENLWIDRLSGGVSCDVYRAELPGRTVCIKRALPKLRVKADWRAPAERSSSEVAWLKLAVSIAPGHVPAVLGEDRSRNLFAMEFFPPERFPVWKARLAAGDIDVKFAGDVGATIGRIHAATAGRADIAQAFANDAQFRALRLDPFLLYVAEKHDDIEGELRAMVQCVAGARIALMHGDVSPKNILAGPDGPIFLDAETTCYGDPAFDLAFCLNHLLLKCVWHPEWIDDYVQSFAALKDAYLAQVDWEALRELEARAARLLPALTLARIDGKSPVEYLNDAQRYRVRAEAIRLLKNNPGSLAAIATHWSDFVAPR
jgi:aminoglycoside phosphotransferase (APT) family kinase protein